VQALGGRGLLQREQNSSPEGVTYSRDIAPILFAKCAPCHRPDGGAPFSLLSYADARQRARLIANVTTSRLMPPWKADPEHEFVGQHPLTDDEIATIRDWVQRGAPEGDRAALPPVPQWTSGWQLGTPDLVVTLPQPYTLQAAGADVSRVFVIAVPTNRLRYVKGLEFRPGNARVVHHANMRLDRTRASRTLDEADPAPGYEGVIWRSATYPDGYFLGWTPGQIAPLLPRGLGWRLEPSTDIVVQLHMVPSGKPETVQPSIAFYFTDEPPQRTPVLIRLARQNIDIPAGEREYTITDSFVLPVDVEVQSVQPHAHYLAQDVRGSATLPDGTTLPLLTIRDWDWRWQHQYRYTVPIDVPRGTALSMRYTYDNSAGNPRNPASPPAHVVWGQRTRDEMGDLWIQVLARNDADRARLQSAIGAKMLAEDIVGYETLIPQYPTRAQLHDDVAVLYLEQGRVNDAVRHFAASLALTPEAASAHFNYATVLVQAGRVEEAIEHFERALTIRPDYAVAHNNLGNALLRRGDADNALRHFQEAARIDPANADAYANLGSVLRARGDFRAAIDALHRAAEISPTALPVLANLASMLATAGDPAVRRPAEAVELAERAAALTRRQDAGVLDVLAAAYASAGRFDEAVNIAQAALSLGPGEPLAGNLRQRLVLYQQRRMFIAP